MEGVRVGKGKIPLVFLSVQSREEESGGCSFPRGPTGG